MTSFGWWETFVPENEEKTNGVRKTNCLRLLISPLRYMKISSSYIYVSELNASGAIISNR